MTSVLKKTVNAFFKEEFWKDTVNGSSLEIQRCSVQLQVLKVRDLYLKHCYYKPTVNQIAMLYTWYHFTGQRSITGAPILIVTMS